MSFQCLEDHSPAKVLEVSRERGNRGYVRETFRGLQDLVMNREVLYCKCFCCRAFRLASSGVQLEGQGNSTFLIKLGLEPQAISPCIGGSSLNQRFNLLSTIACLMYKSLTDAGLHHRALATTAFLCNWNKNFQCAEPEKWRCSQTNPHSACKHQLLLDCFYSPGGTAQGSMS